MSKRTDYDVVIVGAGHNGLICANYLARSGAKVLVLERRDLAGGAAATEEPFPGYKIDVGSATHILIHETSILQDLQLDRFGLEYLDLDPYAYAAFPDGVSLRFYRDVDRTCTEIEKVSPRDAEAYAAFVNQWLQINDLVLDTLRSTPELPKISTRPLMRNPTSAVPLLKPENAHETAFLLLTSYDRLLRFTFESEYVRAPLAFMASQVGVAPDQLGTGNFAGWHALYHTVGVKRPRGGSGALTEALRAALEARGGEVHTGVEVRRIEIADGKVRGITTTDGTAVSARTVVSAVPVTTALLDLVAPDHLDADLCGRLESVSISNSSGLYIRGAATGLPSYKADPGEPPADHHRGLQLLCPSVEYLDNAHKQAQRGQLPRDPAVYALTPSVVDPSLAPAGSHTLYLWGQYYPYRLMDGRSWSDLRESEANRLIEVAAQYAPNIRNILRERVIRTPLDLERDLGLPRGNYMHIDMRLDQMFFMRPLPDLAAHRTPIKGLYITGAGTHPGGGIQGTPGMNAAKVVSLELRAGRKWFWKAATAGALTAAGAILVQRSSRSRKRGIL